MKLENINTFEKLVGQIQATYDEVALLSKKSPNDAVNKFKLKFINTLLIASNKFLGNRYIPFVDFTGFDEDDMPQNSDAAFILSQYLQCFEKFRADHVEKDIGRWFWIVDDAPADKAKIETVTPRRLKE